MLKGRKSTRPEITVIGARPMSDSPFVVDLTRDLYSTNDIRERHDTSNNRFDCTITRTSTLPSARSQDKKERPKSEVFNGFSSLRAARIANGERSHAQRENKKVIRSKSLHAPRKPPRNFPMRPTSTSPCGDITEDQSTAGHLTTITPTRPAPPLPPSAAMFNKKSQVTGKSTALSNEVSHHMEEKRTGNKRNRSKSASTSSDSQKPRKKVELPRGRSFNTHGTRQIIKATQDENVVILSRTSVIDEGRGSNVKLKTFGINTSRLPSSTCSMVTTSSCGGPTEPTNGKEVKSSDRLPQDFIRNDDCNDMEAPGHVSLSDAIQANAVYTRLQQKKGKNPDARQNGSSSGDSICDVDAKSMLLSSSLNPNRDSSTSKHTGGELNDIGLNSSEIGCSADTEVDKNENQRSDGEKPETTYSGTGMNGVEDENGLPGEGQQIYPINTDKQSSNEDIGLSAKPVADNFVKIVAVNSQKIAGPEIFASVKSASSVSDNKKGSPPAVKPKPKIPRRPTVEKMTLLHGAGEKEQIRANVEDTKGKSSAVAVDSGGCAEETSASVCDIVQQGRVALNLEKYNENSPTQGCCQTAKNSQNNSLDLRKENSHDMTGKLLAENSGKRDIDATQRESSHKTLPGNGDGPFKQPGAPINTTVQNTYEDDVFLENSTQTRNKSESEAESAGSLDSLTSLTSQVTVIFNPETKEPMKSHAAGDKPTPGPFESHETNRRRKSTPEPYSSHPERRPKPGKAPPNSSALKPKSRKIKSLYGRRLNASPPSTPPPPPKIEHSDSSPPVDKSKNRPPVPPRAPSMYIQNDSVSIDNGSKATAPPPRPLKHPVFKSPDMIKQPTDSVFGKGSAIPSDSVVAGENDSSEISRVVANSSSEFISTAEALAEVDLRQQATNTSSSQPKKDFSRKLEYFKESVDKPQKAFTLYKQKSLDSYQGKLSTAQAGTLPSNFAQLRKEGEEALRTVSRLRLENGDVAMNKKKSPAPQKPKRPSSVNMDSVVIFDVSEVGKSIEIDALSSKNAKLGGRIPPPKPERSPLTRKSNAFEIKKTAPVNIQTEAKELIPEEVLPHVELRSMDAEQCKNLKSPNEKKPVPKKPVRTSSLKRKNHSPIKTETRKEPTVGIVNEEERLTKKDVDSALNLKSKCNDVDTDNKTGTRFGVDVTPDRTNVDSIGKDLEKERLCNSPVKKEVLDHLVVAEVGSSVKNSGDQTGMTSHTSAIGCVFDTSRSQIVDEYCSINHKIVSNDYDNNSPKLVMDKAESCYTQNERKRSSTSSSNSSASWKTDLSEALSTQIDQLERILLETSSVLSEGLSDTVCSLDGSVEQAMEGVENNNKDGRTVENEFIGCSSPTALQGDSTDGSSLIQCERTMLLDSCLKLEENNTNLNDSFKDDKELEKNLTTVSNSSADDGRYSCFREGKPGEGFPHSSSKGSDTQTNSVPSQRDSSSIDVNLTSHVQYDGKSGKSPPPKPTRSKSLSKVTNLDVNEQNDRGVRNVPDRPSRPPGIESSYESHSGTLEMDCKEAARPLIKRANSAPDRPSLLYFPRKSRPPIPSILREKKAENSCDDDNNSRNVQDVQEATKLAETRANKTGQDVSCKQNEDHFLLSEKPAALAIYSFVAGSKDELSFDSGDTIELLARKSEDLLVGRCNDREGSFPASFVAIINPLKEGSCVGTNISKTQPAPVDRSLKDDSINNARSSSEGGPNVNEIEKSSEYEIEGCTCTEGASYQVGSAEDQTLKCDQETRLICPVDEECLKANLEEKTGLFQKVS